METSSQNENPVISVQNLTKDYGHGRGNFDVSFSVKRGEVFGFLGPNGAGKTTTIRHLLGFSKPQSGSTAIMGIDCWAKPEDVQKHLGYVAGEIAFPEGMQGWQFLKQIIDMRKLGQAGIDRAKELCEFFKLNTNAKLKRMSKGTKQKIALVVAFMHDPEILILDEPTSGLDPLMQARFVELIEREKSRGKTILMSSHMFDEVEKTCDRVAIIKQGRVIAETDLKNIDDKTRKKYEVKKFSLEKYFMDFYKEDEVKVASVQENPWGVKDETAI